MLQLHLVHKRTGKFRLILGRCLKVTCPQNNLHTNHQAVSGNHSAGGLVHHHWFKGHLLFLFSFTQPTWSCISSGCCSPLPITRTPVCKAAMLHRFVFLDQVRLDFENIGLWLSSVDQIWCGRQMRGTADGPILGFTNCLVESLACLLRKQSLCDGLLLHAH